MQRNTFFLIYTNISAKKVANNAQSPMYCAYFFGFFLFFVGTFGYFYYFCAVFLIKIVKQFH